MYVLSRAKEMAVEIGYAVHTKSSLMVGLGETRDELTEAFEALRAVDVDILTVGQYLRPSEKHLPLERYYHPDEFAEMKAEALALGFKHVESAPLVRSSYHARDQVPGAELKRPAPPQATLDAEGRVVPLAAGRAVASHARHGRIGRGGQMCTTRTKWPKATVHPMHVARIPAVMCITRKRLGCRGTSPAGSASGAHDTGRHIALLALSPRHAPPRPVGHRMPVLGRVRGSRSPASASSNRIALVHSTSPQAGMRRTTTVIYAEVGPFGCPNEAGCPNTLAFRPSGQVVFERSNGEPVVISIAPADDGTIATSPGEFFGVAVPPSSTAGQLGAEPIPYSLGHCGLMSGVDVDGSWWDPVGFVDIDHGDAINAASGMFAPATPTTPSSPPTTGSRSASSGASARSTCRCACDSVLDRITPRRSIGQRRSRG